MKLERIFMAASSGTKSQSAAVAAICRVSSPLARTSKPMSAIVSRMIVTSLIFGTLRSVVGSSLSVAAAISFRTAFLAPAIWTSP